MRRHSLHLLLPRFACAVTVLFLAAIGSSGVLMYPQTARASTLMTVHYCVDVYVRSSPGGAIIGTLYEQQHFEMYDRTSSQYYYYGFAYGNVNKWGWADKSCFWSW